MGSTYNLSYVHIFIFFLPNPRHNVAALQLAILPHLSKLRKATYLSSVPSTTASLVPHCASPRTPTVLSTSTSLMLQATCLSLGHPISVTALASRPSTPHAIPHPTLVLDIYGGAMALTRDEPVFMICGEGRGRPPPRARHPPPYRCS